MAGTPVNTMCPARTAGRHEMGLVGDVLLPHRGFLWRGGFLARSPLRRVEGILNGLAGLEPHRLASSDFDGLPALRVPTLACRPLRHTETAEAGDTDRLSSHEGIENSGYHGLDRLPCRRLI